MLQVVRIEPAKDTKNNGKFRSVWFLDLEEKGNSFIPTNTMKMRNIFSKNDNTKGDVLWDLIESGNVKTNDFFSGSIIKYNTTPYSIGDNLVTSLTLVVFKGEDGEKLADSQLKANLASIVVDGAVRSFKQTEKPVTT